MVPTGNFVSQTAGVYPATGLISTATTYGTTVAFPAWGATASTCANYCFLNGFPVGAPVFAASTVYPAGCIVQSVGIVYFCILGYTSSGTLPAANATNWTAITTTGTGGIATTATVQYSQSVASSTATGSSYPIFFRWGSSEKVVLSPFTFADIHEWDTGLFGINNIQLIMNLQAPTRLVRNCSQFGCNILPGSIAFNTNVASPFANSKINVQFLTPSLDVPLPPKSVVPYMEFPRYITSATGQSISAGSVFTIQSQTITLPTIPDLFIIYVKPTILAGQSVPYLPTEGDFYFPLATPADQVYNPLTINFDNFAGLLSSQTAYQLYAMSVKNGLEMDFNSWSGLMSPSLNTVGTVIPFSSTSPVLAGRVPGVGGILVLKPSQDITLQTGQAPSLVGNFTFQFNIQVKNTLSQSITGYQMFVITANSGFFESIRGSSRIIKGVLSEQDIISAPLAPQGTRDMLCRYVGGGGIMKSMANVLSKAKDIYHATKPIHGMVKGAMGMGDAAPDSGSGGRRSRKGLEARLM